MTSISIRERLAVGKALREQVPRTTHGPWAPPADRRDPIETLECSSRGRLPKLIPLRYGRMLRDPFTFLRGSSALMACDLAATPTTGIQVQACGDCHLLNFGLFATPERNLIFDITDFDETLRTPWEWDLKRLTTSLVVAARLNGIADRRCKDVAVACRALLLGPSSRVFRDESPGDLVLSGHGRGFDRDSFRRRGSKPREHIAAKARLRGRETVSENHRGNGWATSLRRESSGHDARHTRPMARTDSRGN